MIACIDRKFYDTDKAQACWPMELVINNREGSVTYRGKVFLSSKGNWYMELPQMQPAYNARFELTDPWDLVNRWQNYLSPEDMKDILVKAELETG